MLVHCNLLLDDFLNKVFIIFMRLFGHGMRQRAGEWTGQNDKSQRLIFLTNCRGTRVTIPIQIPI